MRFFTPKYLYLFICGLLLASGAMAQRAFENIVQIDGVTMTADSLRGVANVTVLVKNQNRGVETGATGVFSIVCYKGDTLQFDALGFRHKEYVIPKTITGQYFSLIQLMVQDTFYLPETIIRPLPTAEGFDYAFKYWRIPDDKYEIARRNTNAYTLRAIAYTLPRDGRESQAIYQGQQARAAVYYNQMPAMNIFNPLAWADFIQAWKRGDFRRQESPYTTY